MPSGATPPGASHTGFGASFIHMVPPQFVNAVHELVETVTEITGRSRPVQSLEPVPLTMVAQPCWELHAETPRPPTQ